MPDKVIIEGENNVLTFTLSNPLKRNAISFGMYDELERGLEDALASNTLRVVILRGAGGAFAGGTDVHDLSSVTTGGEGIAYEAHMRRVQSKLLALRVPVVAVVEGPCAGGGLVLAALSDFVYCTPEAVFGSPVARTMGNTVSASSVARLFECFGRRRTAEVLLAGRLIPAAEAERSGFVTELVSTELLEEKIDKLISDVRVCSPATIASFKEIERRIDSSVMNINVDDVFERIYGGPDFREGVSAFMEKRTPQFAD